MRESDRSFYSNVKPWCLDLVLQTFAIPSSNMQNPVGLGTCGYGGMGLEQELFSGLIFSFSISLNSPIFRSNLTPFRSNLLS